MSNFIGYTIGLECWVDGKIRSVKIEYAKTSNDSVRLSAVSGKNLDSFGSKYSTTISRPDFEARTTGPYSPSDEAIWALSAVGLTPSALDADS